MIKYLQMKFLFKTLILAFLFIGCQGETSNHQVEKETEDQHSNHNNNETADEGKKNPLSPRTASMANIGSTHIHIDYGSPSKRGRMIFGGLVGYGQVWATGAHKATSIDFSSEVIINEVSIPAGKYGLFTIPGESEWVIIINKVWDMHLADDYNEEFDLVRVTVPVEISSEPVESLTFEVHEENETSGFVSIKWDLTEVKLPVKL